MTMLRSVCSAVLCVTPLSVLAGDLEPAEAPSSTPGPEPRIAINVDNTPGDGVSLFRIIESGSYYLESHISISSALDLDGLFIMASDVTVDLNGFSVRRIPLSQAPDAGPQGEIALVSGIRASGEVESIRILNGHVSGWSDCGVDLSEIPNCSVVDVTARDNTGSGIEMGAGANIEGCIAEGNGAFGIIASEDSAVRGCVSRNNLGTGISASSGSVVTDCTASGNGGVGISASSFSTVGNCSAQNNDGIGIQLLGRGHIHNCTAGANGAEGIRGSVEAHIESCTATGNTGSGIVTVGGGMVADCSATDNTGNGIEVTFVEASVVNNNANNNGQAGIAISTNNCRIDGNYMADNSIGLSVTGTSNIITRNTTSTSLDTAFSIADGNAVASIRTNLSVTGPWDNFDL